MSIFLQLLLIACVVVYVVDLSGWTDTWLGWLSRFTKRYGYPPVRTLRPFSCSQCMTWWCGLAWAFASGQLSLPTVAFIAAISFLTVTIREGFIFMRETLTNAIAKVNKWLND